MGIAGMLALTLAQPAVDAETSAEPAEPALEELPELPELEPLPELAPLPVVPAVSPDGAPTPSGDASTHGEDEDEGLSLRDVMTGSLRLVGAFLHVPDIPEIYPAGDDALVAA